MSGPDLHQRLARCRHGPHNNYMHLRGLSAVCLAATLTLPAATSVVVPVQASTGAAPQRRQPVPSPFPRPGNTGRDTIETPVERPLTPAAVPTAAAEGVPTEATLGLPIYPNARFITSYDAGRGQRFYLFGTNSSFQEMVSYYAVVLDKRGDRVFDDSPPTHMFEIGRFREDEMAFPPGVTVKDYTWNGSAGYLNPTGEPARFRTIIQLVPAPLVQPRR